MFFEIYPALENCGRDENYIKNERRYQERMPKLFGTVKFVLRSCARNCLSGSKRAKLGKLNMDCKDLLLLRMSEWISRRAEDRTFPCYIEYTTPLDYVNAIHRCPSSRWSTDVVIDHIAECLR